MICDQHELPILQIHNESGDIKYTGQTLLFDLRVQYRFNATLHLQVVVASASGK